MDTTPVRPTRRVGKILSALGSAAVISVLLTSTALASPALLTPGHAYCYYFSSPGRWGGMHLVAASPTVISAGPSNYISGVDGKPQDTVFYIECVGGSEDTGGYAYVGLPRIVLVPSGGQYVFNRHVVVGGLRHLEGSSTKTFAATVNLSGTVSAGVINGVMRITAPGCLSKTVAIRYAGR